MRQQLIQYVELLFAGAPGSDEIKQEILQNTLDRYDDLVSQGKTEAAAYRLAISGIGDINEILGQPTEYTPPTSQPRQPESEDREQRKLRAVAIAMYILCPIPLFILSEFDLATMGLCLTLALVATATYLLMLAKRNEPEEESEAAGVPVSPKKQAVGRILGPVTLVLYLLVSFLTHAWAITWLIFPISGCIKGIINAVIDLKEVNSYEN